MSSLERYFQPNFAFAVILTLAALQYAMFAIYLFGGGPGFVFGGDFVAFWSAARETLNGEMVSLYAPDGLSAAIEAHRPDAGVAGLTWQYPPHASAIFAPIGLLPFEAAYMLWCGLGLACFAWTLSSIGVRGRALVAVMASIPVLIVLNTGQNALFTASLMLLAVFNAKPKPVIAGLAAAVLTLKPQLGILLPVLFLAGGHWRAFASAALASLVIWGGSALALGADTWAAFFEFLTVISGSVSDGVMPLYKMVNVYAAARLAWLPNGLAVVLAGLSYLIAIAAVVGACRKTSDPKWRYGVLAAATLLTAPYSMYYELVLLVPAIWFAAHRAHQAGWLAWERESLAVLVGLTLFLPGPTTQAGISLGFLAAALVAIVLYRRLRADVQLSPN